MVKPMVAVIIRNPSSGKEEGDYNLLIVRLIGIFISRLDLSWMDDL